MFFNEVETTKNIMLRHDEIMNSNMKVKDVGRRYLSNQKLRLDQEKNAKIKSHTKKIYYKDK